MSANAFRFYVVASAGLMLGGHYARWVFGWSVLGWQLAFFSVLFWASVAGAVKDARRSAGAAGGQVSDDAFCYRCGAGPAEDDRNAPLSEGR